MRIAARTLCCLSLMASLTHTGQVTANDVSTRIFGGEEAQASDWPWMTALRISFSDGTAGFCGGQQISPDWVLTAAHCLVKDGHNGARVEATVADVFYGAPTFPNGDFPAPGSGDEPAGLMILHGAFNFRNLLEGYDIALIPVSEAPLLQRYPDLADDTLVQALEAAPALDRDDRMTALGWGETAPSSGISETLQQVALDYINRAACGSFWFSADTDLLVCAGEPNPPFDAELGQDTCRGDSGGPLLTGTPDDPVIVGLTSFGSSQGCGLAHVPSGYTSTADMVDWIEQITASPPGGAPAHPLIDAAIAIPRYHTMPANTPDGYTIDFSLRNDSKMNAATLQRLTLTGENMDNLSLSLENSVCPDADCDLSAEMPLAPNDELAGQVALSSLPAGDDQRVTMSLQLDTQEHDYRSSNNRPTVRIFLTDKPDLNLVAPGFVRGTFTQQQRRASVRTRLENLSTHASTEGAGLSIVLPPATQLLNRQALQCTQSAEGLFCPAPPLAPGGQHSMTLELSSLDGLPRTLQLTAHTPAGTFGVGQTEAAVAVQYPDTETPVLRMGSGGALWGGLLLILILLRRRHVNRHVWPDPSRHKVCAGHQ
ncbi:serine protease [Isoalcanivorax indicus]|uniref:serine protease n=1 Tax=Isoalcanivorax indicus TaxID=2202653 RepID=UPI000DBA7078|nr:serine protease [Isoalcanivorax indicus]